MTDNAFEKQIAMCSANAQAPECSKFHEELIQEYRKEQRKREINECVVADTAKGMTIGGGVGAGVGGFAGILPGLGIGATVGYFYGGFYDCTRSK